MEIKSVLTPNAPQPGGHYSQAVIHNGLIYVAGQLPIDPATGEKKLGSIEEQTEQVLANIRAILLSAGSDLNRVLKMTVYVSDMELWGRVNEVYARVLGEHRPARAIVPVKELHYGFLIEIEGHRRAVNPAQSREAALLRWARSGCLTIDVRKLHSKELLDKTTE